MNVIPATTNLFGGILPDPEALPEDLTEFSVSLRDSAHLWKKKGFQVIWLEIPISKSNLIPGAVKIGFKFHHCGKNYLMLTCQLQSGAFIPPFATHYIGAGGVVINKEMELLVVWEKIHKLSRPYYYKLPGGAIKQGEHIIDGVIREVFEETGVRTEFISLACFRHWHGYRYGKSDLYFVCRLAPLTHEITMDENEIEEALWMPIEQYLTSKQVGYFNKRIVEIALGEGGMHRGRSEDFQKSSTSHEIYL